MITSCLYQFYNMAWWYSSVVIAYTKYLDIIIDPVSFNPLQNHSAEHFACHIKQHNIMPVFAASQVRKRTRETSKHQ